MAAVSNDRQEGYSDTAHPAACDDGGAGYGGIMKGARFPADLRSVSAARRFVRQVLPDAWSARLDDVLLLVSELVTNAIVHARSAVQVTVSVFNGTTRVEVSDAEPMVPVQRRAGCAALSGRGLAMVEIVADRWGVLTRTNGKTIWFEVDAKRV